MTIPSYTLSLHDALPILILARPRASRTWRVKESQNVWKHWRAGTNRADGPRCICGTVLFADDHRDRQKQGERSEEHTSELQSRGHRVCRLLFEKKKQSQQ